MQNRHHRKGQKGSSLSASVEKSLKIVSKNSEECLLQKRISHVLNKWSLYDNRKFQNPFTEASTEDTTTDGPGLHISD